MAKDDLRLAENKLATACQEALREGTRITWLTQHYSNYHKQYGVIVSPPKLDRVLVRNEKTGKTYGIYVSTLLVSGVEIIEE